MYLKRFKIFYRPTLTNTQSCNLLRPLVVVQKELELVARTLDGVRSRKLLTTHCSFNTTSVHANSSSRT